MLFNICGNLQKKLTTIWLFLIVTVLGTRFTSAILVCRIVLPGTVALGLSQFFMAVIETAWFSRRIFSP